eukprot:CAMPEP_0172668826 /NCGR_PEP_ID=MMETSP1074-20121228/9299_1 /TAXON_ID=2916 /ORGANISM="Ceratium fusus, Strain PA161109" /LENGTH=463 /DNA_ID=CAMNT_0013485519 /DNA_START=32 /DNA_END=1419 /DNA_ORIENTATION=-
MRPFGSLGPQIDVSGYAEQLDAKVAVVKQTMAAAIPVSVLQAAAIFPTTPTGHRCRAGPFAVRPGSASDGSTLELAMWDAIAKDHSVVRAHAVPIYAAPIAAAMEALRTLPIFTDVDNSNYETNDVFSSSWGAVVGHGLRSVQFHSTLTHELLVCFIYHDKRLKSRRRNEKLQGEEQASAEWEAAAKILRSALQDAMAASGVETRVDITGRWKRRRLVVERDYVVERLNLSNGRTLTYRQPEGQFSNPNAQCEIRCLEWLCDQASQIASTCGQEPVHLLELHCGGGNNTVALAPYFARVHAVEINRVLAEAAEENLRINDIHNVQLERAPSAMANLARSAAATAQAVLVDPPRSGLDAETLQLVSGFKHVLYISCNPCALVSDLLALDESHESVAVAIFDMFPYTTHAECAVRLRQRPSKQRMPSKMWWWTWFCIVGSNKSSQLTRLSGLATSLVMTTALTLA